MKLKGVINMRFDNYYVSEYKRVIDNVKANEELLSKVAEDVEARVNNIQSENTKKIIVASAVALTIGAGVVVAVRKRKLKV